MQDRVSRGHERKKRRGGKKPIGEEMAMCANRQQRPREKVNMSDAKMLFL
jgi:hypothetical protein